MLTSAMGAKGPSLCHCSAALCITCLFALLFWRWLCLHTAHFCAPEQPYMENDMSQVAWVAQGTLCSVLGGHTAQ